MKGEDYVLINTNELIFFTPHPPLPLKGGGLALWSKFNYSTG
jgi:hypothetical protein